MSNARKTKSGKWCNQVYAGINENGKRRYIRFYGDTRKEADAKAAQYAADRELGIQRNTSPANLTVAAAFDKYITDQTAILSPKTIREYDQYRRNHFAELKNRKISTLTTPIVQHAVNAEAAGHAPKTVRNVYGFFLAVMHYVNKDISFDVNLPQLRPHEMTIPTAEEFSRVLDYVRDTSMEVPVLLAATCGLRRGEIAAIDLRKDVDYAHGTVRVNKALSHSKDGEWIEKAPKTTAGNRTVTAPSWVVERFRELAPAYQPMLPTSITTEWMRLADKLGIGDVRFHDLRHYYASALLAMGVPDKYAMKRTGHSTNSMLKNVYQHLMDSKDAEINSQTEEWFSAFAPLESCNTERNTAKSCNTECNTASRATSDKAEKKRKTE